MTSASSESDTDPSATAEQQRLLHRQPEDWCLSIKTVGGGFDDRKSNENSKISSSGERLFSVTVSPEDAVASLYQEIEGATGVKPSQQRLIYRGRIINDHPPLALDEEDDGQAAKGLNDDQNNNNDALDDADVAINNSNPDNSNNGKKNGLNNDPRSRKIKDIAGLCDGQTIHLVKKRERPNTNTDSASPRSSNNSSRNSSIEAAADLLGGSPSSAGGGGAFLAALLGLGSLSDDGLGGGMDEASATPATISSRRSSRRSNRRPHYRLTADDLEVPDPGSMEPVRQGLMTLHTLLPHSSLHRETGTSPLEANREWFRGQWLDCRDTVNQWLEATVVEILRPEDILPSDMAVSALSSSTSITNRRPPTVDNDPAVSANDLEGRRRLLLEPCTPGDPHELSGPLAGYRPRSNNDGVQLLLIHYNGWPHRWDEWIRSDSERIRPFRTRTRHPNSSSFASPTPQSVFSDAPRTNISIGDEETDRTVLLPELNRALSQVNALVEELVQRGQSCDDADRTQPVPSRRPDEDLPWLAPAGNNEGDFGEESDDDEDYITAEMAELEVFQPPQSNIVVPVQDANDETGVTESSALSTDNQTSIETASNSSYSQRELRHLATVLDRLGRTLTDAAPHIASLAATLPQDMPSSLSQESETTSEAMSAPELDTPLAPLGGLLSLWSRERRRQNNTIETNAAPSFVPPVVDPDHIDYASGLVNTTRGEVRSGPRSRSSQDDIANLLGAYLAAASLSGIGSSGDDNGDENMAGLGRLFARGGTGNGGNGGGIDIHIHAVVTTGGTGGTGIIGIGGSPVGANAGGVGTPTGTLGGTAARNLFSNTRSSRSLLRTRHHAAATTSSGGGGEDENEDLFSELYSENPTPVDPSGSPGPRENGNSSVSSIRNVLSSPSSDLSSRGTFEDRPMGSSDSTPHRRTTSHRFSSVPHRRRSSERQSIGSRSSGMFRLFRRRSRTNQNDESTT
ncbi:ubiquitin family protein [Nitzschia inconspicua]|uniref:Ubiquitin family protein n=1 Tax=Nitzschia inconspicua TaxID=303405 RepID=A0A9K3LRK5_9STRA|nr:ubiquitin family protein [Nitzschia inconspicua]